MFVYVEIFGKSMLYRTLDGKRERKRGQRESEIDGVKETQRKKEKENKKGRRNKIRSREKGLIKL